MFLMNCGLLLSLIVYFGAMGTIWFQVAGPQMLICGAFSVSLILSDDHSMKLAKRCWPLWLMAGIAMFSSLWSVSPSYTFRQALQLLFAIALGIALVGRLGAVNAIKLFIQALCWACLLSAIWALAWPFIGVHQSTDNYQSVHAGLWRGVLAHKVTLGTTAGMTLGLLIAYGWKVFSNPLTYIGAVIISIVCLLGSGSATGIVVTIVLVGTSYTARLLAQWPNSLSRKAVRILAVLMIGLIAIMFSGLGNQFAALLGKSADLTGRADYWPYVIEVVNNGSFLIGYGYIAGFRSLTPLLNDLSGNLLTEAHNGALDMLVAFGYIGATVILLLYFALFLQSLRLITLAPPEVAKLAMLPYSVIATTITISYAESVMLTNIGIWTVLLSLAVACGAEIKMKIRKPVPAHSQSLEPVHQTG